MRDLFNSSRHKLSKSPNTINLIVMKYGMTLEMKIMRELAQLEEKDRRFTLTIDEWISSKFKQYMIVNVHTFLNGIVLDLGADSLLWMFGC